jgi:hypothetical protein
MRFLNSLVLLTLLSCAAPEARQSFENGAYRTSGVEQFFLPELPEWANFSAAGKCSKSRSFQYLEFSRLARNYQLSYPELIELQAQYNARLEDYFKSTAKNFLKPMEESSFFTNTLEQVRGGVRLLKLPRVSEVDVIWLEGFIQTGQEKQLIRMLQQGKFDERLPILFSSCLSKMALQQWILLNKLEEQGLYTISAEWLSPFDASFSRRPGFYLHLQPLLGPVKLNLIAPPNHPLNNELIL